MGIKLKKVEGTFLQPENNPTLAQASAGMLGVAFELTASYKKGTRLGPDAVHRASFQQELQPPFSRKDISEQIKIHHYGILEFDHLKDYRKKITKKQEIREAEKMVKEVRKIVKKTMNENKPMVLLGGEHSIVNGAIEALNEKVGAKKACLIYFDGHLDMRQALNDNPFSHGSVLYRGMKWGFKPVVIGSRDFVSEEESYAIEQRKIRDNILYCATQPKEYYTKLKNTPWIKKENLIFNGIATERQIKKIISKIDRKNMWISIDIDCISSTDYAGTGTPMPFGLKLEGLNQILYKIIEFAKKKNKKIWGFDIVEVSPQARNVLEKYNEQKTAGVCNEMIAAVLCYNILQWIYQEKIRE